MGSARNSVATAQAKTAMIGYARQGTVCKNSRKLESSGSTNQSAIAVSTVLGAKAKTKIKRPTRSPSAMTPRERSDQAESSPAYTHWIPARIAAIPTEESWYFALAPLNGSATTANRTSVDMAEISESKATHRYTHARITMTFTGAST